MSINAAMTRAEVTVGLEDFHRGPPHKIHLLPFDTNTVRPKKDSIASQTRNPKTIDRYPLTDRFKVFRRRKPQPLCCHKIENEQIEIGRATSTKRTITHKFRKHASKSR
mmetsp:Transcript_26776/g.75109  ORF Transcript_26776/g.75109 Transcript_26776/m.75109 type:complete len:109 (+) Transcript_26776:281-607(+)